MASNAPVGDPQWHQNINSAYWTIPNNQVRINEDAARLDKVEEALVEVSSKLEILTTAIEEVVSDLIELLDKKNNEFPFPNATSGGTYAYTVGSSTGAHSINIPVQSP